MTSLVPVSTETKHKFSFDTEFTKSTIEYITDFNGWVSNIVLSMDFVKDEVAPRVDYANGGYVAEIQRQMIEAQKLFNEPKGEQHDLVLTFANIREARAFIETMVILSEHIANVDPRQKAQLMMNKLTKKLKKNEF